jgi:biopolymer transport protein ExbD
MTKGLARSLEAGGYSMSWSIRHEGSPRFVAGITFTELARGLRDGLWEPTDEVLGPGDPDWLAIENHPQCAELALEIEIQPPKQHEDETRLDMTALVDVTMVLLIFFILTTGYATLQKMIDLSPSSTSDRPRPFVPGRGLLVIVHVVQEANGNWGLRVENDPVKPEGLRVKLSQFVKDGQRTDLLIDCPDNAPRDLMIAILDAAKQAGMKPHDLRPMKESKDPAKD